MIEFIYGEGSGKISLKDKREGLHKIELRIPSEGFFHESLEIEITKNNLMELKSLLRSRPQGKVKLGKTEGISKEYLLFERDGENSRVKIELNSWFLFLGSSLGDRIRKADTDLLYDLLEKNF